MTENFADLHIHTYYSDSTFSPEEVMRTASKAGLKAVGICDHDCVEGIAPSIKYGKIYDIEVIPGIELSVDRKGTEVHILGYFIDWKSKKLKEKIKIIEEDRIKRIHKMLKLLKEKGIDIKAEDVLKAAGRGTCGRPHVASAMLKAKKINSIQEAFNKYIGGGKSCYVSHIKFTPKEAISIILETGGVPVLAHPKTMHNDSYIYEFIGLGIKGIEVYHSDHNSSDIKKYLDIAKKENLLATGGSDCHGVRKSASFIGRVKMPYSVVEELRSKVNELKKK